jgi:polar amino acid transport system substrate-binding protein
MTPRLGRLQTEILKKNGCRIPRDGGGRQEVVAWNDIYHLMRHFDIISNVNLRRLSLQDFFIDSYTGPFCPHFIQSSSMKDTHGFMEGCHMLLFTSKRSWIPGPSCFFLAIVIFIGTGQKVSAQTQAGVNQVTFASESWALATEKDGSGLYWDLFRAVYEPVGIEVNTTIRSYQGSVNLLEHQLVDAMVGAYENEIGKGIYPKNYFAVDIVVAVGRNEKMASWEGQKTIENKRVGWIKGYSYDEYLDVNVIKNTFNDRESIFRGLDHGRIDYGLDARADITEFLLSGKGRADQYATQTLLELKLFTVFAMTEKGRKLAHIFDQRFSELLQSGEVQKLYNHYINDKKAPFTNPFP